MSAAQGNVNRRVVSLFFGGVGLAVITTGALPVPAADVGLAEPPKLNWKTDYAAAHEQRKSQQRPMLVFVSMDGCHFCDRMLATTYADASVASQIQTSFVATYVDGLRQRELAQRFGVRVYPTTYLIAPDNRVLDRIEGYMGADAFKSRIRAAAQTGANTRQADAGSQTR